MLRTAGDAVRVRTADPDRAQQLLRELATDTYSLQRIGDYIEVRRVPTERVVEHLVHNGLTPTEVLPQRQDLEHVFLELTQEPVARR
ncbi:MAG: hypothetical protein JO031_08710 [Ktedonobacteraceae bacterium]|nr:hypothetical protein [Ktedonobacteraceae bacterium]